VNKVMKDVANRITYEGVIDRDSVNFPSVIEEVVVNLRDIQDFITKTEAEQTNIISGLKKISGEANPFVKILEDVQTKRYLESNKVIGGILDIICDRNVYPEYSRLVNRYRDLILRNSELVWLEYKSRQAKEFIAKRDRMKESLQKIVALEDKSKAGPYLKIIAQELGLKPTELNTLDEGAYAIIRDGIEGVKDTYFNKGVIIQEEVADYEKVLNPLVANIELV